MSWDGHPGPCSDAWGQYGEYTNESWKQRGDRLREDLADWESSGGSREIWCEDRGLGDYHRKDRKARWYNDLF